MDTNVKCGDGPQTMEGAQALRGRGHSRRRLLLAGLGSAAWPWHAHAVPSTTSARPPVSVVQFVDVSPQQQELSRDHAAGVSLALALHNRQRGVRAIRLTRVDVAAPEDLQRGVAALAQDREVVAVLGSCGERLALRSIAACREARIPIAHVGPWLGDARFDADPDVVALFASREQQLRHALRSLEAMGVKSIGVVYATAADRQLLASGVQALAQRLALRLQGFGGQGEDAARLAAQMNDQTPPVLLFLGGAVELSQFSQALTQRRLQRYVVSLSDTDVSAIVQLGALRTVPLIVTQVVPNPANSPLPVVREYREGLKLLFEEAPSPMNLAGYLTGRYFAQSIAGLEGSIGREAALAHYRRRPPVELGGFALDFARGERGSQFVTQTILTADGRLVG